jgi:hypothetical protein
MPLPNTAPIFSRVGDVTTNGTTGMSQLVTAAAPDYTGIDADYALVFTADATNGGIIERLRFKAGGTNVATVARIFINNGSTPATATNNAFYGEVALPATTATNTAPTIDIDYPLGFALPPGFRVYFGIATAVAAGWTCIAIGGKF